MKLSVKKLLAVVVGMYLICTCVGVALLYYHPDTVRFDSPDETANYFWIQRLADGQSLGVAEPLNSVAENQIHPRSINVRNDGSLVPGTFLGFIVLLGFIGSFLGTTAVLFVTPLLGACGGLAIFGIVRRLFDEKVALLATTFLLFSPIWLYYSVTSLYTNIAFISLTCLGLYLLLTMYESLTTTRSVLAGMALALAVSIRPNELVWVSFITIVVLIALAQKLHLKQLIILIATAVSVLLPQFFLQQQLFGSSFVTGYNQLHLVDQQCTACRVTQGLTIPFGFHPKVALYNFWHYFAQPFWWLLVLAFGGFIYWLRTQHAFIRSELLKQKLLIIISVLVSLFLIIYYGSLPYGDPAIAALNQIGLSFVRYWLPIVVFAMPWIAFLLHKLITRFSQRLQRVLLGFVLVLWVVVGYRVSVLPVTDGLGAMATRMDQYRSHTAQLEQVTEEDSVIITTRSDKVIFPDRRVIHTFTPYENNTELQRIVAQLAQLVPVYVWAEKPSTGNNGFQVGNQFLYRVE